MSSKLLPLSDAHRGSPICWREMGSPQAMAALDAVHSPEAGRAAAEREAELERRWRQEVDRARTDGYREGEAAGRERAGAEMRPITEQVARSLEELALLRPRLRQQAEGDMLRLAMAIAQRVLRRELAVDPEALRGLAMAALEKLGAQEIHRVRVHASMVDEVRALLASAPGRARVEVIPDPAGEPGTIVFETERGNLDASIETQLQEIERGLADCLRRKG
jgi:flagellar assembly protein FliH